MKIDDSSDIEKWKSVFDKNPDYSYFSDFSILKCADKDKVLGFRF